MAQVVIVGAGLAGAVLAQRIAETGQKVLIIEKRNHIGGNCYDYYNKDGILVPKYGIHAFHTNNEKVWDYVQRFSKWIPYEHRVCAIINNKIINLPPKEKHAKQVFNGYTKKMWAEFANLLKPEVQGRIRIREDNDEDTRYFKDKYQFMPKHGWAVFFDNLLNSPNIEVLLNTDYFQTKLKCDWFSGRCDEYFGFSHGKLPYRSLRFKHKTSESFGWHTIEGKTNYPDSHKYTRIYVPQVWTRQKHKLTARIKEFPTWDGEPYYPVPTIETDALADKYRDKKLIGRLGLYKYMNMDEVILKSLKINTLFPE